MLLVCLIIQKKACFPSRSHVFCFVFYLALLNCIVNTGKTKKVINYADILKKMENEKLICFRSRKF